MRRYNFDEYVSKNRKVFCVQRAKMGNRRKIRRRPRSEAEWQAFFIMTEYKMDRWIKEGHLQKYALRKYRIYI